MASWHAKETGAYPKGSDELTDNARLITELLLNKGWSLSSICAILGNCEVICGLNPWRWTDDEVPAVSEFQSWTPGVAGTHGYGLFEFTPPDKYINAVNSNSFSTWYGPNFSDRDGKITDGEAQTRYFSESVESSWSHDQHDYYYDAFQTIGINIDAFYDMGFEEFKTGRKDNVNLPNAYLVGAFELCYLKPDSLNATSTYSERLGNAVDWYNYFIYNPPTPSTPTPNKMPLWMMMWWY